MGASDESFLQEIEALGSGFFRNENRNDIEDPRSGPALESLLAAAGMIVSRDDVDLAHPLVDRVLETVSRFGIEFPFRSRQAFDLARRCRRIAARSRRLETALSYIDFCLRCQRVPDLGMDIDDERLSLAICASDVAAEIAAAHPEAVETKLVGELSRRRDAGTTEVIALAKLISRIGTERSFAALCEHIHGSGLAYGHWFHVREFWDAVFHFIERRGFDPGLIARLNDHLAREARAERIIDPYRRNLGEFAENLHRRGRDLFEVLEGNRMQFWDYWRIYHPV